MRGYDLETGHAAAHRWADIGKRMFLEKAAGCFLHVATETIVAQAFSATCNGFVT